MVFIFFLILLFSGMHLPPYSDLTALWSILGPSQNFPPREPADEAATAYWHIYTSPTLGFTLRYPDGIVAREWPGTEKGVEFVRQRDLGREIIPILLTIHEVGQRGDKPEACRQYFCEKTALLQEVHFNNAYGVRTFDYGYDYYLTDAKRQGKVLRINLTNLVNSDDFEFVEIITTLRFDRN